MKDYPKVTREAFKFVTETIKHKIFSGSHQKNSTPSAKTSLRAYVFTKGQDYI